MNTLFFCLAMAHLWMFFERPLHATKSRVMVFRKRQLSAKCAVLFRISITSETTTLATTLYLSKKLLCLTKLNALGPVSRRLAWIIHEVSSQKEKDALKGMMNTGFLDPAFPFGASIT